MPNKSYTKGYRFENEFVNQLRKQGRLCGRFHKSVGPYWKPDYDRPYKNQYHAKYAPVDVWDAFEGKYRLYQIKNNTSIPTEEMLDLIEFANDFPDIAVYLVTKRGKTTHTWLISQ